MTQCPTCGSPLARGEPTCPGCGTVIGEAVPSTLAKDGGGDPGKPCPECGTFNPDEARYCVRCRHSFAGEVTIFGINYLVVPLLIGIVLVVLAVMAFSTGLAAGDDLQTTTGGDAARAGAGGTAQQVLNQTRSVTPNETSARAAGTPNTTSSFATPAGTPGITPTRTVDPNATPWNAAIGAGINHTEGGTHYVGLSRELQLLRQQAAATPTPVSPLGYGDGSGHATGPLSWVGQGNWSPGTIDLPSGDIDVVLLSQGTTAFILVDADGSQAGIGAFTPPGGTLTVTIPAAGPFVIAFGAANATDTWSATVMLPESGGQASAPPVATPATQILAFAGTGGGLAGSFNLTPGTVHVQLYADQMTMAYLKDPWGVILSTTVAGPHPGGSTVAITRAGAYSLETWGTGAWTAAVTWTGAAVTGGSTVPPMPSGGTGTPSIGIGTPSQRPVGVATQNASPTLPPTVAVPSPAATIAIPVDTLSPLRWSGSGSQVTPFFTLQPGLYRVTAETSSGATVNLLDAEGKHASLDLWELYLLTDDSAVLGIEDPGPFVLDIQGEAYPWTFTLAPVSLDAAPMAEPVVLTGSGDAGLGPFHLRSGLTTIVITSDRLLYARLLDAGGSWIDGFSHDPDAGTSTHAFNVPSDGIYFLNVVPIGREPWVVTIRAGQ